MTAADPEGWTCTIQHISDDPDHRCEPKTYPETLPSMDAAVRAILGMFHVTGINGTIRDTIRGSDTYYRIIYGFEKNKIGMPDYVVTVHQHKHSAKDIGARIAQRAADERKFAALTANIELH